MKHAAIYPGSFDPVTEGHIDIMKRAAQVFDKIIVAVANNLQKQPLFTIEERIEMLKNSTRDIKGLEVESFDGLVTAFARQKNANVLIRGLRMLSDFEYEFQMALTNRRLANDIETVFLMPSEKHSFISSSLLKEAASLGADISTFVPKDAERRLKERLKK